MRRHIALFALDGASGTGPPQSAILLANALTARAWRVDLLLHRRRGDLLTTVDAAVRIVALEGRPGVRNVRALLEARASDLFWRASTWHRASEWPFWSLIRLQSYLVNNRPEALCAFGTKQCVTAAITRAAGGETPIVATISAHLSTWLRRRQPRKHAMVRRIAQADCLVGCSQAVTSDAGRLLGLPAHRQRTIPEPVITSALAAQATRPPPTHPWLRAAVDDPDAPPVLVNAGRLVAVKDHTTLLRAFARLAGSPQLPRLVIFGEGELRASLHALAEELNVADRVDLAGYRSPLGLELAAARLYVLSSCSEGLGKTLIEALACGVPAVATDCGGPREILQQGRLGALVPPGDAAALAAAIERALAQAPERAALIERARWFNPERYADGFEALLNDLALQASR